MHYKNIVEGNFIDRPNRFVAHVEIDGSVKEAHVKNTGRCKELLLPGSRVCLQYFPNSKAAGDLKASRKMAYDIVSVYKNNRLINMDSQSTNKAVNEWLLKGGDGLFGNISLIKPESRFKDSRFDFYLEAEGKKIYLEVKGVTLEDKDIVYFPDAPTSRGVKHVKELTEIAQSGEKDLEAWLIFAIQLENVKYLTTSEEIDAEFARALREAYRAGVNILAYDCIIRPDEITLNKPVKVFL